MLRRKQVLQQVEWAQQFQRPQAKLLPIQQRKQDTLWPISPRQPRMPLEQQVGELMMLQGRLAMLQPMLLFK
jgi:hypothetical protein